MRRARPVLLACLLGCALPGTALAREVAAPEAAGVHGDTPQEVRLDLAAEAPSEQDAAAVSYLPTTWCGTAPSAADDTQNAAHPPTSAQFKLVYAYPSDRPNRFAQWRDHLQANASLITRFVAAQSGGRKAPRLDLGTSCGPGYADVAVVELPEARAFYVERASAVRDAVNSALGPAAGRRTPVILADGLSAGGVWGVGSLYVDDSPGATNAHNHYATSSIIWVPDGYGPPASAASGFWPAGFLHEMTHNMGGVQWTSPHNSGPNTDGSFHCWDGYDLMCYRDSASMPHPYETSHCGLVSGAIDEVYDCGGDDYFNPAPAAGSYLATHWNVFDSLFLGDCATLGDACGREDGVPAATIAPSVSGSGRVGATLTGSAGTWSGSPVLSLQWQRDAGAGWQAVAGATGTAFTPSEADAGSFVRLRVTATNGSGSATATSGGVLVTERVPPAEVSAPAIGGTARRDELLDGFRGVWTGASSYAFRWERQGSDGGWAPIAGATDEDHVAGPGDVGRRLRLRVIATNADGSTAATSAPTTAVADVAAAAGAAPVAVPVFGDPIDDVVAPPAPGTSSAPPPPATVVPPPVNLVRTVRLRRGGRPVAALAVRVAGAAGALVATVRRNRLRAPSGRYRLRVCGVRCATRTLTARGGRLVVPAVAVALREGSALRVTLSGPRLRAAGVVAAVVA